jgi:NAD(P)-dependent dehydrogenase (short-subunit alcohol dehydrogenase family)
LPPPLGPSYADAVSANYPDLAGKHVLITGGSGGIGGGVTPAFAAQGSVVSVIGKEAALGRAMEDRCKGLRGPVRCWECDVADADALVATVRAIVAERGPVDVLVNNAGWDPRYQTTKMSVEQWDQLFALNVRHYFVTCRELIPGMIERGGGSIIMTTSHQLWIAFGELACYNATKAAIVGFVRSLAREVGRHKIRVNAVAPGWVLTERQLREMLTEETKKKLLEEQQILPIALTPEDLAGSYLFLASEASRPITRQTLVVDAGFAMA